MRRVRGALSLQNGSDNPKRPRHTAIALPLKADICHFEMWARVSRSEFMVDAAEIASKEELERWLADKPRTWAVAIAARAALRVLPVLGIPAARRRVASARVGLTLAVFRATLVSSAAAVGPADDTALRDAAAAADAAVYATADATTAAAAAAYAADAAAYADADATTTAADAAAYAADAAAYADATTAAAAFWKALSSDAHTITISGSDDPVGTLLRTPLWPQTDVPAWVRKCWTMLLGDDALRDTGFAPWFEWYEGLLPLPGATPINRFGPGLTRRISFRPKEWWDRGAKAVNADIAAWLAEREAGKAVPPQVPAAFRFKPEGERIGVAPLVPTTTDPTAAQTFLDELRERAAQAADRLESARNAAPFLAAEVSRLHAFLPVDAADLNPFLLRCRLASIDAAVVTLQTAGSARELSDDPTMQVTGLALIGRELMLCFPDQRTREREEIARAIPLGQEQQIVEALAETSKAAAQAPEVVTEQAVAALETMGTLAREVTSGPAEAQRERIVEQVLVDRNFRSEVARFGWDLWDRAQPGTLDGVGSVSKHAVIFGFAGLVGALTNPVLGAAAVFAGYGQIDRMLNFLEGVFTKRTKELKETKKKPRAKG